MSYWLYNNKTGKKHDKLTLSECGDVLLSLSEKDLSSWFAWQKSWANWRPVKDVPDLMSLYQVSEEPPPPPPPMMEEPPTFNLNEEEETVKIDLNELEKKANTDHHPDPNHPANRRRHPRFNIRFKVIIESDVLTFRSFTSNISLGGLALEHSLPDKLLSNDCKIYISDLDNSETIMFNIKPVKHGSDLKYFSFENLDDYYQRKLENWLANHSNNKINS